MFPSVMEVVWPSRVLILLSLTIIDRKGSFSISLVFHVLEDETKGDEIIWRTLLAARTSHLFFNTFPS